MVGQTLRFDVVVRALKRESRGIGPLTTLSINQRFEPSDRSWIDTLGSGGMLLNTGVHGFDLLRFLTPRYGREGKSYLTIAIGCTGGRHRSVYVAELIGSELAADGHHVTVRHRDLGRS